MNAAAGASEPNEAPLRAWFGLLVLIAIGLYMYMDRQILALQMEPIRAQLSLSDFQVGLVQGLSVAIFATLVGYPIGWLADRVDRRYVLAGSIALWSLAVVACGLSQSFEHLFIASAIVGAGEAGLLPITYALIPELFRGRSRQTANSLFIVVGRLGVGFVIFLSGLLVQNVDALRPILPGALAALDTWRLALFVLAMPGLPIALFVLSMPVSRGAPAAAAKPAAEPVWPFLRPHLKTFLPFYLGVGLLVFGNSAVGAFLPMIAIRQMGASPLEVGSAMGAATFITTLIGLGVTVFGMRMVRAGPRFPLLMLAGSSALGMVGCLLMLTAQDATQLFWIFGVQLVFVMTGSMLFPTALQELTPTRLRARLISIIITINIVFGALSPAVVGAVSDALSDLPNGLLVATTATAVVALAMSAIFLIACARRYPGTISAARAVDAEHAAGASPA